MGFLQKLLYHIIDIGIHTDGTESDLVGNSGLSFVDADIGGVFILGSHLPKRIFDDAGGIVADA